MNDRPTCGAKTRAGGVCQRPPARGRTRCRLHGGATPRGLASPHYRGRGYSKDLPTRLADHYLDTLDDPDRLSSVHELALLDARIWQLVKRLHTGETGSQWAAMKRAHDDFKAAAEVEDTTGARETLTRLMKAVDESVASCRQDSRSFPPGDRRSFEVRRTVGAGAVCQAFPPRDRRHPACPRTRETHGRTPGTVGRPAPSKRARTRTDPCSGSYAKGHVTQADGMPSSPPHIEAASCSPVTVTRPSDGSLPSETPSRPRGLRRTTETRLITATPSS